jgi:hypothetical protein
MNVVTIIVVILWNVIWVRNNVVYLWIQEELQEGYNNNKGARAELL